jgi:hypothetical protein
MNARNQRSGPASTAARLSSPKQGNHFYLKHPDDKGDHILVNDCSYIVGVIDWKWAQTVSRAEAFCSPCTLWPVAKFYEGSNELAGRKWG